MEDCKIIEEAHRGSSMNRIQGAYSLVTKDTLAYGGLTATA